MRGIIRAGTAYMLLIFVAVAAVSPAQGAAPKPGTTCQSLGEKIVSGKLTFTCAKSGSTLVWSKGYQLPLRVLTKTLPAAISGEPYRVQIEVSGGTGYHFCHLRQGSGLPRGYFLNPKTCIITGIGETLPAGTTMRISPPFVIIVTDSATPKKATLQLTASIVTYPPPALLTIVSNPVPCVVGKECNSLIATVSGSNPPYTFTLGTGGFPPLGLFLRQDGDSAFITGLARVADRGREFEICAVDIAGRATCKKASIAVEEAPNFVVTVDKVGDGQGTVVADYGPINCGGVCQGNYAVGTDARLDARALPGSVFAGWSGDCAGTGSCALKIDANRHVVATFRLNASGTYSGLATIPNLNVSGLTGCEGSTRTMSLTIQESVDGKITGKSTISFSGNRVGNVITVTASTIHGLRGPYVWQWDGTNLTGSLPWFCYNLSSGVVVNESTYSFAYKRS